MQLQGPVLHQPCPLHGASQTLLPLFLLWLLLKAVHLLLKCECPYQDDLSFSQKISKEKTALALELNETKERIDAAIAAGVRDQTSAEVRKWLAEPQATEEALDEAKRIPELLSK